MKATSAKHATIDEYIAAFPQEVQTILGKLRQPIRLAVPNATEKISYQMPTFYRRYSDFLPLPERFCVGFDHA
jgi:uncharacterized protein YdhG (YjbR/CyaY superfamily)